MEEKIKRKRWRGGEERRGRVIKEGGRKRREEGREETEKKRAVNITTLPMNAVPLC